MITEAEIDRMFDMGFDCSQIVLGEVSERLGMSKGEAYRVAACFGIGMAQDGVCGAATGALMALGLKYGNDRPGEIEKKGKLFDIRDEFVRKFREMNGHVDCPDLLGQRIHTLQDLMITRPSGLYSNCPKYCYNAIMILQDML